MRTVRPVFGSRKTTQSVQLIPGGPLRACRRRFTPQKHKGAAAFAAFHFVYVPKINYGFSSPAPGGPRNCDATALPC